MSQYLNNKFKLCKKIYTECLNKNKKNVDYIKFQIAITEVLKLVGKCEDDYHDQVAKELSKPKTSFKTYWAILKIF